MDGLPQSRERGKGNCDIAKLLLINAITFNDISAVFIDVENLCYLRCWKRE